MTVAFLRCGINKNLLLLLLIHICYFSSKCSSILALERLHITLKHLPVSAADMIKRT